MSDVRYLGLDSEDTYDDSEESTELLDKVIITRIEATTKTRTEIMDKVMLQLVEKSNVLGLRGCKVTGIISAEGPFGTSDVMTIELHGRKQ